MSLSGPYPIVASSKPSLRSFAELASAADRPKDVSFLIDMATRMNSGGDSRFAGRIDLDKIAAAGMSFGGSTTQS